MFTIITYDFDRYVLSIDHVSSELLALKTAGDLISTLSPDANLARVCIYSSHELEPIHTMRPRWPRR